MPQQCKQYVLRKQEISGKNRLFKSVKTIRLRWNFCRSRISAGFGKVPEPEQKSGTVLQKMWSFY